MRKVIKEFQQFAVKGNVIDLAVGVIIGGAFGKIVSSLVDDLIMPPIGILIGKVDFSNLYVALDQAALAKLAEAEIAKGGDGKITLAEAKAGGVATLAYGQFLNNILQFVIVAFAVFLLVRGINRLKARVDEPPAPGEPVIKPCPYCISDIPIKATRCPHCTSEIPSEPIPPSAVNPATA